MATPRPLTSNERSVVEWMLANALNNPGYVVEEDLSELRVVGQCPCGCVSIDFVPEGQSGGATPIADALAISPDGASAGVILWAKEGRLSGLEVHDHAEGASARALSCKLLRTYGEGFG